MEIDDDSVPVLQCSIQRVRYCCRSPPMRNIFRGRKRCSDRRPKNSSFLTFHRTVTRSWYLYFSSNEPSEFRRASLLVVVMIPPAWRNPLHQFPVEYASGRVLHLSSSEEMCELWLYQHPL